MPSQSTVTAPAIDAAIQKKIFGSGTTLIISNKEMDDIMKIVNISWRIRLINKGCWRNNQKRSKRTSR